MGKDKFSYERKKGIGLVIVGSIVFFLPALLVALATGICLITIGIIKISTEKKIETFFKK